MLGFRSWAESPLYRTLLRRVHGPHVGRSEARSPAEWPTTRATKLLAASKLATVSSCRPLAVLALEETLGLLGTQARAVATLKTAKILRHAATVTAGGSSAVTVTVASSRCRVTDSEHCFC